MATLRDVGQPEEAVDGVEQGGSNGRVVVCRGRAEAVPREVEELVAEPRHGSRDRRPVGVTQVGAGGEEAVELATQIGLGAAAELADQGRGAPAVRRGCRADGRDGFDDRRGARGQLSMVRGLVLMWGAEGSATGLVAAR